MQLDDRIVHPIPPTWDRDSEVLILGSFPSVKSRECGYFYGHPQNRFWRVLSVLFGLLFGALMKLIGNFGLLTLWIGGQL